MNMREMNCVGAHDIDVSTLQRPACFGFSPLATPEQNVQALQKSLDGSGLVVIDRPGVYELDDTIFLDSNTHLLCAPGVVFKKSASYCNVLLNRGALTKEYNENIIIEGLEISVNGFDTDPTLVYGLRAQVGFHYVKNLTLKNFRCVDGKEHQYLIYIVTWENLHLDGVTLAGDKDGMKLNNGHDAIIRNLDLTTLDDGMSVCGTDYSTTLVEVGDVYNVSYSNVTDHQYKNIFGRTCLIYTGSWADYADGNEYMISDFCLNAGKLYQCVNPPKEFFVASDAPSHDDGVYIGADGLKWRYVQECDFYHTDVYNISFDNCIFEKSGNILTSWIETGIHHRNYYPGTEGLSNSWGISINNCKMKSNGKQVLVCVNGNMKDIVISNCVVDGLETVIRVNSSASNEEFNASITGCVFKNLKDLFIAVHNVERVVDWAMPFTDPDKPGYIENVETSTTVDGEGAKMSVNCHLSGNSHSDSVFRNMILGDAELRCVNIDLPFYTLDGLSPQQGDLCRSVDGLFIYKSSGWTDLSA